MMPFPEELTIQISAQSIQSKISAIIQPRFVCKRLPK